MRRNDTYFDLDGKAISLAGLDAEERRLVNRLRRRARLKPDWNDFDNFCYRAVGDFYDARGVSRKDSRKTVPFQIAQDLSGRIAVASGSARFGDYRDDLEELIREHFASRAAFCKATGISTAMLSHVMSGRKHLSLAALAQALDRIGYRLRFVAEKEPARQTG